MKYHVLYKSGGNWIFYQDFSTEETAIARIKERHRLDPREKFFIIKGKQLSVDIEPNIIVGAHQRKHKN